MSGTFFRLSKISVHDLESSVVAERCAKGVIGNNVWEPLLTITFISATHQNKVLSLWTADSQLYGRVIFLKKCFVTWEILFMPHTHIYMRIM